MGRRAWSISFAVCVVALLVVPALAQARPRNDDFADAETIVAPLDNVWVENEGATKQPGEPDPRGEPGGASVWFSWTAEKTGGAEFLACYGLEERAIVAVYTGDAVDELTPVPQISGRRDCEFGFQAEAGVSYRIDVDGEVDPETGLATTGESELGLRRFPLNDEFEDAEDLGSSTNLGAGSEWGNLGATKQPGEPEVAGNPGGSSVWFTWTAPTSDTVQLSACEATFEPLIGVYTGSDVAALTPVAAAIGEARTHCNWAPRVNGQLSFQAVAGTRYDFSFDGYDGASGQFTLELVVGPGEVGQTYSFAPRPVAKIVSRHIDAAEREAVFRLHSSIPGSSFRCKLDGHAYKHCGAKVTYRHLDFGRHALRVETVSPAGIDAVSPARASFKLTRPHRRRAENSRRS